MISLGIKINSFPWNDSFHISKRTLLYTKTITSAGNSFMCVCDKCAVWNSYPPWRLSGMCARPCCYGNWHCQLTRSLPFSPSTPSSPWGTQEHSLHTHTHTRMFNIRSVNTLSIQIRKKLQKGGQVFATQSNPFRATWTCSTLWALACTCQWKQRSLWLHCLHYLL